MATESYYIGVDVGTSSARAALVSRTGKVVTSATHPIDIIESQPDYYEQSSENVWHACCKVIKMVAEGVHKSCIRGIGFDATCSLVVLDEQFRPVTVSPAGKDDINIIMWMDHRAAEQAERINATQHEVLKYVGGKISLEMQTPKLLWLKENMKNKCWSRAGHFFDLPDFLTWKATGSLSRSLCSLVCKWTYQANADYCDWNKNFLDKIGLGDLAVDNFRKIGNKVLSPGECCGRGLTPEAAQTMGLTEGTPVATSSIDAHSGGLGTLGCSPHADSDTSVQAIPQTNRLVIISGTSSCHMAVSKDPLFVSGVWGPYYSAMIPGLWLNEGGQSATGKLIDHILETHPAYSWLTEEAKTKDISIHEVLTGVLEFTAKRKAVKSISELTSDLHVWPDFHGNRSPLADATLKGMICGLTLSSGVEDLACLYLATIQSIAYGAKHIIDNLNKSGHNIKLLLFCGGLSKSALFVQTHADVTGLPVLLPEVSESVLLGAAILGACASGDFLSAQDAMQAMGGKGNVVYSDQSVTRYHSKKYQVFMSMVEHQRHYKDIMTTDN